jgi:heat shock protein HtpX
MPKEIIKRKDFPALYALVDSITRASGSEDIYGIVLGGDFNAAYTEIGIRRRKVIYLGVPLFYVLNDEEKVALISHEIAHGINGDISRGIIIHTALETLAVWYEMMVPDINMINSEESIGIITMISNILTWALSKVILSLIILLVHLVYSDSQRAEYLADYIGAKTSGTNAMRSLLNKLHFKKTYYLALQKSALNSESSSFFEELFKEISITPEKELERVRRMERMEGSRLDATHPPTAYRLKLMEQTENFYGKVVLSKEDSVKIRKELDAVTKAFEKKIIDEYKEYIYY